jgi:glycosyltransferase involved in cell wall biosynthesis
MSDLVSVVFPVGPGVFDAGLALDDMVGQTYRNLEVVAVLNGCPELVRGEFLDRDDPRLRVIDLGNKPRLLDALNLAVSESRGRWLARMDADDRCDSTRVEKQVELLEAGECEVVSCGISLKGAMGDGMHRYVDWVNSLDTPDKVLRERFVESPVVQPTVIMTKNLFEKAGGYLRNGFAEDYDLWLRLLERGARFGKIPDLLYDWYDRPDRLTRSDPRFDQKTMLALKADALARLLEIREKGVVISGAGPIGKVLGRELISRRINVRGYFEVSPKRIGSTCQGVPIAGPEEFGRRWRDSILLAAVGAGGGRLKIRMLANEAGFSEGRDFWCCC